MAEDLTLHKPILMYILLVFKSIATECYQKALHRLTAIFHTLSCCKYVYMYVG